MDKVFLCLRCLNDFNNLPNMIDLFASCINASMVVKIGTKYPHLAQSIESEIMDRFYCSKCLYDHIDRLDMMGSFTSGDTTS